MDQILFETPWIKVKRTPNGFDYAERKGVDSIAVLLFRKATNSDIEVLLRMQPLCVDTAIDFGGEQTLFGCPITGSIEPGESRVSAAIREVAEKSGYEVGEEELICVSHYIVGTQTNENVGLFIADVTNHPEPATDNLGDNSYFESVSRNEWWKLEELQFHDYVACQLGYFFIKARLDRTASH